MVDGSRRHEEQAGLLPVGADQHPHVGGGPVAERLERVPREDGAVDDRRERQQAERQRAPLDGVRSGLHLDDEVGGRRDQGLEGDAGDGLAGRLHARALSASVRVTVRATSGVRVCAAAPDWVMAWANRPDADGIASSVVTLIAPADSPATVTRPGSPPKAATLSCTHRSAATWSCRPRFAVPAATSASVNRKPSAANR